MPLIYGGLVSGAKPKDPLKGTPDVQGLKNATLEVWPNGRVKSGSEGVALPVYETDTASIEFDSDTPVEDGVLIVANTATDGTGAQNLYVRLDGSWVDVTGLT